jgi:integrase
MTIETVSDAVGTAKVLYKGRDVHLPVKLDWWCSQLGPNKALLAVTTEDIDTAIGVLMSTPKFHYRRNSGIALGTKLMANGTINKYIAALGSMYKLLRMHRRLPRSYVSPVVRGMLLPLNNAKTLQVSLADVQRLVAAARLSNNRKLPALVSVACTTGLRKGSLQALRWGAVDLKARTLDVGRTKNGTPVRSVLPPWAAVELSRIRPDNPDKGMQVFGPAEFKRAWQSTIERAGLPADWTFHSCRHIAASILAQSGASLPVIMQALNHKSPSMALRYSHVNITALNAAISNAWG